MRRIPFRGQPIARIGCVVIFVIVAGGVLEPVLPLGSATTPSTDQLAGPSWRYPFGTDELGRSLLPRVAEGVRGTVILSAIAVAIATAIGVAFACYSAYRGGRRDEIVARGADVMFSFPVVLTAILVSVIYGPGKVTAVVAIVGIILPITVRVVRSAALEVVHREFIIAARVHGASTWRIVATHILPNVRSVLVVQITYSLSLGMLVEGGISFLGLGVQPPGSSLGLLIGHAHQYLNASPWYTLIPGITLAVAVMSVNVIGGGMSAGGASPELGKQAR